MATNTSGLSISKISEAVKGPERFAGMHFVNPPHLIALVEVIAGEKSLPQTMDILRGLAESIERQHVTIYKDPPGFLLNRLQFAFMREATHIVESGYASPEDVDKVMKHALGIRYACVGPFETMDFGGIDTFYNISSYLFADLCDRKDVQDLMRKAFDEGRHGVKSGRGIYDYSGDMAAKAIARRDAKLLAVSKCLRAEKA
jgi:3-hydroxybutyryl-CoA dehydrogenase